jgi:hypothetical protein
MLPGHERAHQSGLNEAGLRQLLPLYLISEHDLTPLLGCQAAKAGQWTISSAWPEQMDEREVPILHE